jgi:hypothetical protein
LLLDTITPDFLNKKYKSFIKYVTYSYYYTEYKLMNTTNYFMYSLEFGCLPCYSPFFSLWFDFLKSFLTTKQLLIIILFFNIELFLYLTNDFLTIIWPMFYFLNNVETQTPIIHFFIFILFDKCVFWQLFDQCFNFWPMFLLYIPLYLYHYIIVRHFSIFLINKWQGKEKIHMRVFS